jgi:hypothetical protein
MLEVLSHFLEFTSTRAHSLRYAVALCRNMSTTVTAALLPRWTFQPLWSASSKLHQRSVLEKSLTP